MIEIGVLTPEAAVGPRRDPSGKTELGRVTTTDEQRAWAIHEISAAVVKGRGSEARATIQWSRGEPTILEIAFAIEHIEGEKVYLPMKITEYTLTGAEIPANEEARLRTLQDEVAEIHDRAMI